MRWHDLLFAHWRIDAQALRALVPPALAIDSFDGSAWIGVVPFRMTGVRPRFVPPLPWLTAFPELNVRTYVTSGGKAGVWFLSLDAARWLAVIAARAAFHLPYVHARMRCVERDGWIEYASERREPGRRGVSPASFRARYRPTGPGSFAVAGSLAHFLTARYCLYAADASGAVFRSEIDHPPWPLAAAEVEIERNTMLAAHGLATPREPPLLHFARRLEVVGWMPERVPEPPEHVEVRERST